MQFLEPNWFLRILTQGGSSKTIFHSYLYDIYLFHLREDGEEKSEYKKVIDVGQDIPVENTGENWKEEKGKSENLHLNAVTSDVWA